MIKRRYKPRAQPFRMAGRATGTGHESRTRTGSALILTVVLTSMLAIVGMMFVMAARVDKMSTSAIAENKELNFAVETVVSQISAVLVDDLFGDDTKMLNGRGDSFGGGDNDEYYDYPDANNAWLASLEPYEDGLSDYRWRQISDVYSKLSSNADLPAEIIPDYQDSSDVGEGELADADGDGVADSKWIELDDMTSGKGRPIYAAIRVIDNGGMLNVNTAYEFDANETNPERIDGRSQTQINLAALRRGTTEPFINLDNMRKGGEIWDLDRYIDDVVWRIEKPDGLWTPFDISDELKLRNRYIINKTSINTRIDALWTKAFNWEPYVPRYKLKHSITEPNDWFWRANNSSWDPDKYDYRHISTTYNMDRIIDPDGGKMLNINDANVSSVYRAIIGANLNIVNVDEIAAQIAVNLVDFRDNDSNVSVFDEDGDGVPDYYGFERPCIYISELAHNFVSPIPPDSEPYRSYAVELYKPYFEDEDPNNWRLVIDSTQIDINSWTGSKQFFVIQNQNLQALLDVDLSAATQSSNALTFSSISTISLQRLVAGDWIIVDSVTVPAASGNWLDIDVGAQSIQRDIQPHKCIRRLWDSVAKTPELGKGNTFVDSDDPDVIQAHPANKDFTNIGEIGILFRRAAYYDNVLDDPVLLGVIGYSIGADVEEEVRLDLADPDFQQIFNYLTVWPPFVYVSDPNETRIKGRININTAPWYVIAQLPWMKPEIAQAIVDYRDKHNLSSSISGIDYSNRETATGINNLRKAEGFASIGELNFVIGGGDDYSMHYYELDTSDLDGFPDLTPGGSTGDGAEGDFEERDVIFARISNLVTVRSDVFTAYILVRIGADGPQKRAVVILDRSDVYSAEGRVRVRALHPVPDPR